MIREKVDSSSIHSHASDETGSEFQFHAPDCAKLRQGRPGSTKREMPHGGDAPPRACNCEGGEVYHYPGVPAELHAAVVESPSIGQAFARSIKGARHPHTKELLYPHTKREAVK